MVNQEQIKQDLAKLRDTIDKAADALHLPHLREELEELKEEMNAPEFWNDLERSTAVNRKVSQIENKINRVNTLHARADDVEAMLELLMEDEDESIAEECENELAALRSDADELELETLMRGEYDHCDCILSLHAGAGGTEAQDWTSMLYRMYTRWAERHGFTYKILDYLDGDEAGLKSATILISGSYAYGYLKSEGGVHRLVRVSPFDSSGRRHTSFASVEVMPELEDDGSIEIRDEDIEIETHRASGAGGQHINKTDSAVRIIHKPTGIVVGCQTERSQLQNRETCMKMLKSKLLEIKEREKLDKIDDIKGEKLNIEWGSQIRSYVFMPYTLVKDTRTGYEDGNISSVMDGNIDEFINAYLKAKGNFLK